MVIQHNMTSSNANRQQFIQITRKDYGAPSVDMNYGQQMMRRSFYV